MPKPPDHRPSTCPQCSGPVHTVPIGSPECGPDGVAHIVCGGCAAGNGLPGAIRITPDRRRDQDITWEPNMDFLMTENGATIGRSATSLTAIRSRVSQL